MLRASVDAMGDIFDFSRTFSKLVRPTSFLEAPPQTALDLFPQTLAVRHHKTNAVLQNSRLGDVIEDDNCVEEAGADDDEDCVDDGAKGDDVDDERCVEDADDDDCVEETPETEKEKPEQKAREVKRREGRDAELHRDAELLADDFLGKLRGIRKKIPNQLARQMKAAATISTLKDRLDQIYAEMSGLRRLDRDMRQNHFNQNLGLSDLDVEQM